MASFQKPVYIVTTAVHVPVFIKLPQNKPVSAASLQSYSIAQGLWLDPSVYTFQCLTGKVDNNDSNNIMYIYRNLENFQG